MMKRFKKFITKRKIIVSTSSIGIVLLGVYVLLSLTAWADIARGAEAQEVQAAQLKADFFATKDTTTARRQAIIEQLTMPKQISCKPSTVISWQSTVIQKFKTYHLECQAMVDKRNKQARQGSVVAEYYKIIDAVATLIKKLKIDEAAADSASYDKYIATVRDVKNEFKTMSVTGDPSKKVQLASLEAVSEIETSWAALIKANKEENRTAYVKAEKNLVAAYKGLSVISAESEAVYSEITSQL